MLGDFNAHIIAAHLLELDQAAVLQEFDDPHANARSVGDPGGAELCDIAVVAIVGILKMRQGNANEAFWGATYLQSNDAKVSRPASELIQASNSARPGLSIGLVRRCPRRSHRAASKLANGSSSVISVTVAREIGVVEVLDHALDVADRCGAAMPEAQPSRYVKLRE